MAEPTVPIEEVPETVEAAAARWFARKRSGMMTAQEAGALEVWLARDPEHRAVFDQTEYWWGAASALRNDPSILTLREDVAARPRKRMFVGGAMAASLAVAVLGGWSAVSSGLVPAPAFMEAQQTFRTGVGQTATVRLRDGSVVTLDTDTVLRARLTEDRRSIRLSKGQAFFKVAKDASRPFVVAAGDKLVTATGTAFTVRVEKEQVEVTLVEGRVRVEEAPPPLRAPAAPPVESTDMKPGSKLVAVEDRHWTLDRVDTSKATSWMEGQLIFEDRALGEVVAELNRYSDRKIVIADAAVAATPITGAFATGDVEAFVSAVRAYRLAAIVSESRGEVELSAVE
jgi:transmembrane sensor